MEKGSSAGIGFAMGLEMHGNCFFFLFFSDRLISSDRVAVIRDGIDPSEHPIDYLN